MAITEESRHHMLVALEGAIGKEATMTLAEHLPPAGWNEMATRDDLALLEGRLTVRIDGLDDRIHTLDERLSTRIDGLDDRIHTLDERLSTRIDGLEERLEARFDRSDARFVTFAGMMGARFDRIDTRFQGLADTVDSRFDRIGHRLDALDRFTAESARRFDRLDRTCEAIGQRLGGIEAAQAHLRTMPWQLLLAHLAAVAAFVGVVIALSHP